LFALQGRIAAAKSFMKKAEVQVFSFFLLKLYFACLLFEQTWEPN